jgi:hypothetical protein
VRGKYSVPGTKYQVARRVCAGLVLGTRYLVLVATARARTAAAARTASFMLRVPWTKVTLPLGRLRSKLRAAGACVRMRRKQAFP